MRLDKFVANLWYGSRKQIAKYVKDEVIAVNWETVYDKDFEVHFWDIVNIWEEDIEYKEFIYVMLNKSSWYISSKKAEWGHKSYLDLMTSCPYSKVIDIVWRLDFDTTGLVFLTNDGALTHKVIQPKKDIFKKYYVKSDLCLTDKDITKLEKWVKIDDFITKPAIVEIISEKELFLSISEWKFHQVKKMLEAVWNNVMELKRVSIANLELWDLKLWEWRYLTDDEVNQLKEEIGK